MSDYRYQIVEHNGIECLKVMIDGPEYEANGKLSRDSEGNEIIQAHIPTDDILNSMEAAGLTSFGTKRFSPITVSGPAMQITPPARLTDEMLEQFRAVVREELQSAKKQQTAHTAEDEDAFLRSVLRGQLRMYAITLPQYRAEIARLDKLKGGE